MNRTVAVLGIAAAIGGSAPAHAEPGAQPSAEDVAAVSNSGFLDSLRAAGITYANPGQAVAAGRAVCGLAGGGEPGLEVIADIKANNPGFTTDGAAQFAAIAARAYCPQQLLKN